MSKIVDRTLDFIELFAAERRPLSLSDISRLLSIPVSSCHDVLRALQARGYLYEIGPRAGFYPTNRLLDLATVIAEHDPLLVKAEGQLRRLRDEIGESASLAKADDGSATYLLVMEPQTPLRFMVNVGSRIRSLHATSAGKALLGALSPQTFEAYLKNAELKPMTPKTIRSKDELRADIEASRKRGYYLNREESVEDATTVSATFQKHGATYIVTIAGPTTRMVPKLEQAARLVMEVCAVLGQPVSPRPG